MNLKFARVNSLPDPAEASTVYFLKHPTQADYVSVYLSNSDGSELRRLPTIEDIESLIPEVAGTADSLTNARVLSASGDVDITFDPFDGSEDVSGSATLSTTGIVAGAYFKLTVDAKGRATAGENPTTLAGFGITDAASSTDLSNHINDGDVHLGDGQKAWLDAVIGTVSATEAGYLDGVTSAIQTQLNNKQASLGFTAENAANKGAANGYAPLNGAGQVPEENLPSYVDDVLEFDNLAAFPAEGEEGKIYIAKDDSKAYRWTGSIYFWINSSVGHADTADTLFTSRTIEITGDATWEVDFNGGNDVSAVLTLAETGVVAGTYPKVTVDAKGRVTEGADLTAEDIPELDATTVLAAGSVTLVSAEW